MSKLTIGWREWINFPELQLQSIKAKIDTGARTSALHAFNIERFRRQHQDWVRFCTQPLQYSPEPVQICETRLKDVRYVTNSGGHRERRCVIETLIELGGQRWPVELTLTNRRNMKFRMLLGRHAMRSRILVDPARSYLTGDYTHRYAATARTG
ncbi:MAG: ATP-dependent zinc protease [Thiolinea sp.]